MEGILGPLMLWILAGTGDAAVFNIGDNGIIIFLMVPRFGIYLC